MKYRRRTCISFKNDRAHGSKTPLPQIEEPTEEEDEEASVEEASVEEDSKEAEDTNTFEEEIKEAEDANIVQGNIGLEEIDVKKLHWPMVF